MFGNKDKKPDYANRGIDAEDSMKDEWDKPITAKPLSADKAREALLKKVMDKLANNGITPNSSIEEMEEYMKKNNIPIPDLNVLGKRKRTSNEVKIYVMGQVDALNALGKSIISSGDNIDETIFSRRDIVTAISDALDIVIRLGKQEVKKIEDEENKRDYDEPI